MGTIPTPNVRDIDYFTEVCNFNVLFRGKVGNVFNF